jgi:U4/U6.U5 tri-snRNP-associated protein 1
LDKYDEELNGTKKKSFKLGDRGVYDVSDEKYIERLNEEYKSRAIKLDLTDFKVTNDYYTPEELVSTLF